MGNRPMPRHPAAPDPPRLEVADKALAIHGILAGRQGSLQSEFSV